MTFNTNDITLIGELVLVSLYGIDKFFMSRKSDTADGVTILQGQIAGYKAEVDKLQAELHEMSKQISALQGINTEKDNQLQMLERIFQNRNPEMDSFMKNTVTALTAIEHNLTVITEKLTDYEPRPIKRRPQKARITLSN